ncbi:MAG: DUF2723 domain-containing protein [Gemmatimonadetes bacterium]|nr:DUF2723 domain-containing protein [Gemmatimonadota bacterium]
MVTALRSALPWLVAFAFFVIYRLSLAPSIVFGDSGELLTASSVLGVAHPPGYPLYTLLGNIALRIGGGTALAMNTLSALLAAASVGLLFAVVRRATGALAPALLAAIVFGSSPTWWSESIITEVYPLSLLLLIAAAGCVYAKDARLFLLGIYLLGLGAVHHPINVFYGAPLFVVAAFRLRRENTNTWIAALALLLGPLSLLAYLKIRAASDAPLVWSQLTTWGDTWDHFMRTGYGDLLASDGRGRGIPFLAKGLLLGRVLREELALTALLLGSLGFLWGAFRAWRRPLIIAVTLALFLGAVLLPAILTWEDTAFSTASNRVFFIPLVALLAALAGYGAQALGRFPRLAWLPWAAVLLAAGGIAIRFGSIDQRGNYAAADTARAFLSPLPPESNLIVGNGQILMPVLYLQTLEDVRTDVVVDEPKGIWRKRPSGGAPYFTNKENADVMAKRVTIAGETSPVIAVPFGVGWGVGTGDGARDRDPFAMTEVAIRSLPDHRIRAAEREVVFAFHLQYARVMQARGRRDAMIRQIALAKHYAKSADGGETLLSGVARALGVRPDEIKQLEQTTQPAEDN